VKRLSGILSIEAGQTESVAFEGLDVHKISIKVDKNVSGVNVAVEKVDKPEEIPEVAGIAYDYVNITATNLTDVNVTAKVEFKVNKSWIADENISEETIKLSRYDGNWTVLPTSKIDEDNTSVYFEAETLGFSIFAISGEEEVEVAITPSPTATPAPVTTSTSKPEEEEGTPTPVPAEVPVISWSMIIVAIIAAAIVVIGIATYFLAFRRKGKGEGKEKEGGEK
jgi:PGF-pre-PGF domain-containing protein